LPETEKMPRIFIAAELPENVKKQISLLNRELDEAGIPAKPVREENLHITLKFIGAAPPGGMARIQTILKESSEEAEPFPVFFRGAGAFPSPERPSVLWAGAAGDKGFLSAIFRQLDRKLAEAGFPGEKRKFHPHVTFARLKKGLRTGERKKLTRWLEAKQSAYFGETEIRRLSLFRSELSSEGASYYPLARFYITEKS
jgi:RNA 2',3'-cyclic 3'-phosphodiesterase